ncbi:hypothetical protein SAY86_027467 [Trapa natans]|uniref:Embryo sac development arrest 6 n=1 Tax=Trapa natans TaxID=22666 RepID=A0AAN7KMF5_TRANT|nr:hypothetical protein SAY86_027467 [Trapa natans]
MSRHSVAVPPRQDMSHHPPRISTPVASRKRKDMEPVLATSAEFVPATPPSAPSTPAGAAAKLPPATGNHLLAGYMAHEFLTKGTLLGQRLDLARPEAAGVGPSGGHGATDLRKMKKPETNHNGRKEQRGYGEVASILKTDGAHIPGIINPTQLARWIQM